MASAPQTAAATAAHLRNAAHRAVDDPATLARAARIIRAGLERGRITLADLVEAEITATLPDREAS